MIRRQALVGSIATLAAGVLLAVTPATHGAFTAVLGTPTTASLNPYLTCAAVVDDERSRGAAVFDYALDDAAGSTQAIDTSGQNNTGSYAGTMSTTTGGLRARSMPCRRDGGTAWAPDGSTSGLDTPVVTLRSRFTFEVRFRTTQSDGVIAGLQPTQYPVSYALAIRSGRIVLTGPGGDIMVGGSGVGDGAWHHLALVVTDDGIAIALDSTLIASNAFNMPDGIPVVWHLAYDASGSLGVPRFAGAMRYAELTNRRLSAAEIHAHDLAGQTPVRIVQATPGPVVTVTPVPEDTPAPQPTASATPEPTMTATASPAPEQTAQPVASATPAPFETAQPVEEAPDGGPIVLVAGGNGQ